MSIAKRDQETIKAKTASLDSQMKKLMNCPKCVEEKRKEKHIIMPSQNMWCPIHGK